MVTKEEYKKAIATIDQYVEEQEELLNRNKMTAGYFVGKIPVIHGKDSTIRLINIILQIIEDNEECKIKYPKSYKGTIYIDDIDEYMQEWGSGYKNHKTVSQYYEYRDKIINSQTDAFSL